MPVFIKASGGGYVCDQVSSLAAQVGFATAGTAVLTWTKPTDVNFKGMVIRYKTGGYPTSPTDGTNAYDSNDAVPVSTITVTGLTDGTLYYFRAFAYCYEGATRVYNDQTTGAQISGTPVQTKGSQTFTSSGTFIVPVGVNSIDVFLVGGGGAGAYGGGGAGAGYTNTYKARSVTPGATVPITIGSGGIATVSVPPGATGGTTSAVVSGVTLTALGGSGGGTSSYSHYGGAGGSGGGMRAGSQDGVSNGYSGGSNGNRGSGAITEAGGAGQGTNTCAFGDTSLTMYSGGGGGGAAGGWGYTSYGGNGGTGGGGAGGNANTGGAGCTGTAGTVNTGGGGGGGANYSGNYLGGNGGSGIVIIRWGY